MLQTNLSRISIWKTAVVLAAVFTLVIFVWLDSSNGAQRTTNTIDLTNPEFPSGGLSRSIDLLTTSLLMTPHGPPPSALPLEVAVLSISPITSTTGIGIVEIEVRNIDSGSFFLPISRNIETLYQNENDSLNRRQFFWSIYLTSKGSPAELHAGEVTTYRSSKDPNSTMELRPQESVVVRFEADLSNPWLEDSSKWKEGIARNEVSAKLRIHENILEAYPLPGKRQYFLYPSQTVISKNSIQLSLQ